MKVRLLQLEDVVRRMTLFLVLNRQNIRTNIRLNIRIVKQQESQTEKQGTKRKAQRSILQGGSICKGDWRKQSSED